MSLYFVFSAVVSVAMAQDSYAVVEGDGSVMVCAQLTGPAGGAEVGVIAEALLEDISKAGTCVDTKLKKFITGQIRVWVDSYMHGLCMDV